MTRATVGVYGGSFDPPHMGHVLSVSWALSAAGLDEVWAVPTWQHVFDKAIQASFEQRVQMCELAFGQCRGASVLEIERELGGPSRSLDTLVALRRRHPSVQFRLMVGADILPSTDRWHRWDEIARQAPPLVIGREGYPHPAGCPISIPNVNSTEIRAALARGQDVAGLVPDRVLDFIRAERLYRDPG
jgi:nicotinate-nucleotide adenylyltransferase